MQHGGVFPSLSKESADVEGVLSSWFVSDGDTVEQDQSLAEVQVDKVSAEVPTPAPGVVRLLVEEDTAVNQGSVIARIE